MTESSIHVYVCIRVSSLTYSREREGISLALASGARLSPGEEGVSGARLSPGEGGSLWSQPLSWGGRESLEPDSLLGREGGSLWSQTLSWGGGSLWIQTLSWGGRESFSVYVYVCIRVSSLTRERAVMRYA